MIGSYLRQIKLAIGPLQEDQGGGVEEQAILFETTGKATEQRINFVVKKDTMGGASFATINLYNLTKDTKQVIARSKTNIQLDAGYEQGDIKLQTIAQGGVTSSINSRPAGGDIITTVVAYDGIAGMGLGKFNQGYAGQVQLKTILKDVAGSLDGVTVDDASIKVSESTRVGTKGLVVTGRSTSILNKLAQRWGFSWFVQNGTFHAIEDQTTTGNVYLISNENNNLINASPRIDNIYQIITGVDVTTVLDPRLQPFDFIELVSQVNPQLNNTYKITNITHSGDSHGGQWTTNIQCLLTTGQFIET